MRHARRVCRLEEQLLGLRVQLSTFERVGRVTPSVDLGDAIGGAVAQHHQSAESSNVLVEVPPHLVVELSRTTGEARVDVLAPVPAVEDEVIAVARGVVLQWCEVLVKRVSRRWTLTYDRDRAVWILLTNNVVELTCERRLTDAVRTFEDYEHAHLPCVGVCLRT